MGAELGALTVGGCEKARRGLNEFSDAVHSGDAGSKWRFGLTRVSEYSGGSGGVSEAGRLPIRSSPWRTRPVSDEGRQARPDAGQWPTTWAGREPANSPARLSPV